MSPLFAYKRRKMKILTEFIESIFPRKCAFCNTKINKRYTCEKCANIIEYYHEKIVISVNKEMECDKIISAIPYDGFMKQKILQYKFHGAKYLAPAFAEIILSKIDKYNLNFDSIVEVPISVKRLRERGYNQSELIAKYIASFTKKSHKKGTLSKIKNNLRQSELGLNERRENVKDAYSIKNIEIIKGKTFILIDDIYTTGATLNECARMLKKSGAQEVIGLAVMYSDLER